MKLSDDLFRKTGNCRDKPYKRDQKKILSFLNREIQLVYCFGYLLGKFECVEEQYESLLTHVEGFHTCAEKLIFQKCRREISFFYYLLVVSEAQFITC